MLKYSIQVIQKKMLNWTWIRTYILHLSSFKKERYCMPPKLEKNTKFLHSVIKAFFKNTLPVWVDVVLSHLRAHLIYPGVTWLYQAIKINHSAFVVLIFAPFTFSKINKKINCSTMWTVLGTAEDTLDHKTTELNIL